MTTGILKQQVATHNIALAWFLAITLGAAFAVGGIITAFDIALNSPAYFMLYVAGLLSPFVASLVYAWQTTGSLAPIRRMYLPLRIGAGWPMILAVPASLAGAYLVGALLGMPFNWAAAQPLSTLLLAAVGWSSIMWAEETGWRGTLLPALQSRYSPLVASVLVAIVWTIWHIPFLFVIGMGWLEIGYFTLQVLGLSAAMTWAYNRSGTALVAVLIHGMGNATGGWLAATMPTLSALDVMPMQAAGPLVLGLVVLLLTKGQLGYKNQ